MHPIFVTYRILYFSFSLYHFLLFIHAICHIKQTNFRGPVIHKLQNYTDQTEQNSVSSLFRFDEKVELLESPSHVEFRVILQSLLNLFFFLLSSQLHNRVGFWNVSGLYSLCKQSAFGIEMNSSHVRRVVREMSAIRKFLYEKVLLFQLNRIKFKRRVSLTKTDESNIIRVQRTWQFQWRMMTVLQAVMDSSFVNSTCGRNCVPRDAVANVATPDW